MEKKELLVLIAHWPHDTESYQNYVHTLHHAGIEIEFGVEFPTASGRTLEDFDGLLLPGGDDVDPKFFGQENNGSREIDSDLDEKQLNICKQFADVKKPIVGICKGCQVLNICFGGNIFQDIPSNVHHQNFQGKAVYHDSTILKGNFLHEMYGDTVKINSSHHQALDQVADGFQIIQYSDDNVIEAIMHESLPFIGYQWHPERLAYDKAEDGIADASPLFNKFREDLLRAATGSI